MAGKCRRCSGDALTEHQFLDAVRTAGLHVDAEGRVALRIGGIAGTADVVSQQIELQRADQQARFEALENTKGFRCRGCGSIYCMSCLFRHAPQHPRGGKACPSCGSTFQVHT
jgi:hypothetical protein